MRAIRDMGFDKLSPIQEQAIPALLEGRDIIGQAQTGTGKTAAFGIPVLMKVDPEMKKLQSIILCPTRELAVQAAAELRKLAKYMHGVKVLPIYGGQDISKQIAGLRGVQIIVGTPGRVMDHMRRHTIKLDDVNMVVLDEADEMLNMGFREDMELILGEIPGEHQTALFSATMPKPILEITGQFQKDAIQIRVAAKELTIPLVSQRYYRVKSQDKDAACIRLLEYYQPKLCLIFCNTKVKVDELSEVLKKAGFQVEGLHGDMSQHLRDVAMHRFRSGISHILIATDVAARGIDVDDVEAVINYDIPQDIEYYVHRIGRTGRAGKTGKSFTFVSNREMFRIREIERVCHTTIEEKKLPGAAKVLKTKADKYLSKAMELKDHEDIELMKAILQRRMENEGLEALDLAAMMLKLEVGDKGEEIEEDKPAPKPRTPLRDRFGRGRDGDRGGRGDRSGRDRAGFGRGEESGSRFERSGRRGHDDKRWTRYEEQSDRRDRKSEAGVAADRDTRRRDRYPDQNRKPEGKKKKTKRFPEGFDFNPLKKLEFGHEHSGKSRRGSEGKPKDLRRDGSEIGSRTPKKHKMRENSGE
ncbi:MAG: DEAD/DEAH box helicase [Acetatifactor sp.]